MCKAVGSKLGTEVGSKEGISVGPALGNELGPIDGISVGSTVGCLLGDAVGFADSQITVILNTPLVTPANPSTSNNISESCSTPNTVNQLVLEDAPKCTLYSPKIVFDESSDPYARIVPIAKSELDASKVTSPSYGILTSICSGNP